MSLDLYLAYIAACFLIAVIPGPTVTVIIANSLAHGTRAGLLNVAGTQLGLGLMMAILVVGLSSVIAAMGWLFDWLRWAGAAYLIWLGWKLLRSPEVLHEQSANSIPRGGFLLQGFLVLMANPKPDGGYAVLTGRAALLSRKRIRLVSRLSGTCLIGGGIWLALTRGR